VTEAMNLQDQLYSEERLLSDVTDLRQLGIRPLVEGIVSRVKEFAGAAPQSDDITIMIVEFSGPAGGEREAA